MKTATTPIIAVLCGSDSAEREVSLVSGREAARALESEGFTVELHDLPGKELPATLDPARQVVFPLFHGGWGENGGVQTLLEARGFAYAGCGPAASKLCMDKVETKFVLAAHSLPVLPQIMFSHDRPPSPSGLVETLGEAVVIKPVAEGSSVGLHMAEGVSALETVLKKLGSGRWMAEPWIRGREVSIGVLEGRALGVVEIRPQGGVYDYSHKYTAGMTEYLFPAPLPEELARQIGEDAAGAFAACGCRDFARVDFMLPPEGDCVILEINTLPGLTPTSLLPKSASCSGYSYPQLLRALVEPALRRFAVAPAAAPTALAS